MLSGLFYGQIQYGTNKVLHVLTFKINETLHMVFSDLFYRQSIDSGKSDMIQLLIYDFVRR